jgi:radical SAM superfamily enzyme YgiQ (UPF0313 family)
VRVPLVSSLFEKVPDDPFYQPRRPLWLPPDMATPPALPRPCGPLHVEPGYALLLNPFYPKDPHGSFGKHVLTPSLSLTSIAAATPPHWRLCYWDENLLQGPPPADPVPEVVGITVHLTFAERAYELARSFSALGSAVILGGMHVQSCPDEAAPHADAIAIGDGVQLWPAILADLERGALRSRYVASYERDFDLDPPVRRDLLSRASFLTTTSLIATRGCRNRCAFCYLSSDGLHVPARVRSVDALRDEIESSGQPYAVFLDNNLGARRDYLYALCRALRPSNVIWSAAVTLDVTDEPRLVRDMALAGCTGVFIGFESLSDDNLASLGKRGARSHDYARRVRILHEHGIAVNGSFVVGFDGDRPDVFERTAAWIDANRLECATFHVLTPYPGTPLFRQLEAEGRLLHREWARYDTAHVVFRPKHMTVEQLALGYDWLYRRLFSADSVWRRRPRDAAAVLPYLAACLLYKRSNRLWRFLIKRQLVHAVWRPFIEWTRLRHLALRRRLEKTITSGSLAKGSRPGRSCRQGV